jgi:salicylate hydroxylase
MSKPPHVLICGAGIAGLVAALALLRRGFRVEVYEQAPELRQIGAGLQIGPNGSRVLIELGLESAMQVVVCEASVKEVRLWNTGQRWTLFALGQDCIDRFGSPYWMVHRGDFHSVLLNAVLGAKAGTVHLGAPVSGYVQTDDGIELLFADSRPSVRGDVVIAADGIHSVLRKSADIVDQTQFTGLMAWRGLVPAAALSADARRAVGINWVGPGGHVITYPLRGGSLFNFVGIVEGVDWSVESWTERGTTDECLADFAKWHAGVHEMIRNIDIPYKWALLGRRPLNAWAFGRMCLIGDAAHPMLPFLAQGANMAIEDGLIVARCLDAYRDDPKRALQHFQSLRLQRTGDIVRKSSDMARTFHNPVLGDHDAAVAYVDREWAAEKVRVRYDWLYEYDAGTVDVSAGSVKA